MTERTARLALEDGSILMGIGFGAEGTQVGEVVFNTSLTGYQEILTDPSYAGQMVVMTATQIGNTGINLEDDESQRIFLNGFIIRELSPVISNWRATKTLDTWLAEQGVIGISEIDTRALTRRLRDNGSQKGVLSTEAHFSNDNLVAQARAWSGLDGIDLVQAVSCDEPYHWTDATDDVWEFKSSSTPSTEKLHVVAYDFGLKRNILRRLAANGCQVTVVPAKTTAAETLALKPDGVLLSNGPGDPSALPYAVEATQQLLGKVPVFGICLGHQILGQALGGKTYRLKFGHHGGNQPVRYTPTGRVEISAHNHNFAVDPASLPAEVEITHLNLNDGCCEGLRHTSLPALSIQYHPEAAPGPHDADPLFDEFVQLMHTHKK
ncbi:MAG: carbamoyl-phosphate synthase small chain [Chloroflexota bacterium]|nr:carbamoyl-phosphate synthase small subunit [Chloroflexota bacterium]NOG64890.1 glutamine-hydrolyzing carbamoyl-phosphate synthase small subunit [Chloroflexota bacterium]GIK66368.1 MAG: carbamoyl-phosphate synthase small chain [Chloroflexota bacterium]